MGEIRKVTKANRSAAWDEVQAMAEADAREAPPTRRCHERAAQAVAADVGLLGARGERRLFGVVLVLLAAVIVLAFTGCVPVEAVRQCELEAAINHGHAGDAALSSESRAIGRAGERAWRAQHVALTGDDVPQAAAQGWEPLEAGR